jgi:hypothetical protein
VLESGSVAYGSATAYKPGVEILRRYFRIETGDDARVTQEKVAGKLLMLSLEDAVMPLLAVVGALPEDSPFRALAAAERRQRAAEAILRLMSARAPPGQWSWCSRICSGPTNRRGAHSTSWSAPCPSGPCSS